MVYFLFLKIRTHRVLSIREDSSGHEYPLSALGAFLFTGKGG